MIYTDLIEYNIFADTKTPLLSCFPSFRSSKLYTLKLLDCTWTIRSLVTWNLDRRSKILFVVFRFSWETRAVKKNSLTLSVSFVFFSCLENLPTFNYNTKDVTRWLLQDKWRFFSIESLVDNLGEVLVHWQKVLGEPQFLFWANIFFQLQTCGCWRVGICCARTYRGR